MEQIGKPLRNAVTPGAEKMDKHQTVSLLEKAADGIDLLFFAYATAVNRGRNPDEKYADLREDWAEFTKAYIRDRSKMTVRGLCSRHPPVV